jgi:hypothetical protein
VGSWIIVRSSDDSHMVSVPLPKKHWNAALKTYGPPIPIAAANDDEDDEEEQEEDSDEEREIDWSDDENGGNIDQGDGEDCLLFKDDGVGVEQAAAQLKDDSESDEDVEDDEPSVVVTEKSMVSCLPQINKCYFIMMFRLFEGE